MGTRRTVYLSDATLDGLGETGNLSARIAEIVALYRAGCARALDQVDLSPTEWAQLSELIARWREPSPWRALYLAQIPGADAALRARLESMSQETLTAAYEAVVRAPTY